MSELFKWLSSNPTATNILIISFGSLAALTIVVYLIAFFQGREISFWPPKIGAKPEKLTGIDKGKGNLHKVILSPTEQQAADALPVTATDIHTILLGKLERLLYLTLAEIADSTGVRSEDIGVHLWIVEQVEGMSSPVLARKARARLSGITSSPTRYWEKGEGIVGQCWKSQSDAWVDLTDPKYQKISYRDWNNLDTEERIGLSYDEFLKTIQYFKAIFATPIVSGEKFIGCISVNIERESIVSFSALWTNDTKKILRRSAGFLEILLK